MTRAVLSILVMFVCLAPMLEVNSTRPDDVKKQVQAVESEFNSLKDYYNTRKDAIAEEFKEIEREIDATFAILEQASGPEFAASKTNFETLKDWYSETKDTFLLFTEVFDNAYEVLQKRIEEVKDLVHENKDSYNTRIDAVAEEFKEIEREIYATFAILEQASGPKFAASKNNLETLKEWYSETKDTFLLFTEVLQKGTEESKFLETEVIKEDL